MRGLKRATVIFDFDGTIADSVHLLIGAINKFADGMGYKRIEPGEVEMLRGRWRCSAGGAPGRSSGTCASR